MMVAPLHRSFAVVESSQVGAVRRAATAEAVRLGFDETTIGRVALVATELATNLVRHARNGRIFLAALERDSDPAIQLISVDDGPGIVNVAAAMRDGASSSGSSPGTGLGAITRMSDRFDIHSSVDSGTIVVADVATHRRNAASPRQPALRYESEGIRFAAPGEVKCGDHFASVLADDTITAIMVDGLGHGESAAAASDAAVESFLATADRPLESIVNAAHAALSGTRGAAVSLARIAGNTLTICGVGNITTRLLSGVTDRTLPSQNGTAGVAVRTPKAITLELPPHAVVLMHSDGIASRWTLTDPSLMRVAPVTMATWLVRAHSRGRDDVSALVLRRVEQ